MELLALSSMFEVRSEHKVCFGASFRLTKGVWAAKKLDGVGPVVNRPSTDKLHYFVKKNITLSDTWNVTCDKWHMTHDRWEEVNLLSKFQLPTSYGLRVRGDMWHLTCNTWHVTPDIWRVSCNTQRGCTLCQKVKSLAFTVWVLTCFKNYEQKDHLLK